MQQNRFCKHIKGQREDDEIDLHEDWQQEKVEGNFQYDILNKCFLDPCGHSNE
jgi:hypothetical protein